MRKNSSRITDLLQEIDNYDIKQQNIQGTIPNNAQKKEISKTNNYWNLSTIHSDVYEFIMNNNPDSNTTNVKMYIIKSDNYNNIDYYSIITVAYNKDLQKTVSNYGIGTEESILSNFNINISEINQGIQDNMINAIEELNAEDDELYSLEIADYLSDNINIIKASSVNKTTLKTVLYELLMNMISKDESDEN